MWKDLEDRVKDWEKWVMGETETTKKISIQ